MMYVVLVFSDIAERITRSLACLCEERLVSRLL